MHKALPICILSSTVDRMYILSSAVNRENTRSSAAFSRFTAEESSAVCTAEERSVHRGE